MKVLPINVKAMLSKLLDDCVMPSGKAVSVKVIVKGEPLATDADGPVRTSVIMICVAVMFTVSKFAVSL